MANLVKERDCWERRQQKTLREKENAGYQNFSFVIFYVGIVKTRHCEVKGYLSKIYLYREGRTVTTNNLLT